MTQEPHLPAPVPGTTPWNHVDHVAFAVHHEHAPRYVDLLSELLDTTFDHKDGPALEGSNLHVYISWETGLELIAPVPSDDVPEKGRAILDHLDRHGESPFATVVRVPDVRAFAERARSLGHAVSEIIQPGTREERRSRYGYTARVDDVQEVFVTQLCGTWLLAGEFDYHAEAYATDARVDVVPGSPPMDHLDHVMYLVHHEHAPHYVDLLSQLFDTTFEHKDGPASEGSNYHVHISWDTGLELVSLLPGEGDGRPNARIMAEHLERRGESLFGAIVRVPDVRAFADRARGLGYDVSDVIQRGDRDDRRAGLGYTTRIDDLQELFVTRLLETWLLAGQIDYRAQI